MSGNVAIIVAGGDGVRAGLEGGKQLAVVAGRPVVGHTIAAFEACEAIDSIVVVVHPLRVTEYAAAVDRLGAEKVEAIVAGGDTRQDSVSSGLSASPDTADIIVVHDGARPLVTPELIELAVSSLFDDTSTDGVVVGHPSYDTVKSSDDEGFVVRTEDRERLWLAQTPQVFRATALRAAYALASSDGFCGTDDASVVEHAGGRIRLLLGPRDNMKVTVPEDLVVVERLLLERRLDS